MVVVSYRCFSGAQRLRRDGNALDFLSQLGHENPISEGYLSELGNITTRVPGTSFVQSSREIPSEDLFVTAGS